MARIRQSFFVYVKHQHSLASLCFAEHLFFTVGGRLLLLLLLFCSAAALTLVSSDTDQLALTLPLLQLVRSIYCTGFCFPCQKFKI